MVQKIIVVKDSSEQNPVPLNMDSSGNIGVTLESGVEVTEAYMLNAYGTNGQSYGTVMTVTGDKMLAIHVTSNAGVTGTWTLSFSASIDGTNYIPTIMITNIADGGDYTSLTGAASLNAGYTLMCAGFKYVRANVSAGITAGSVTVFGRAVA